MRDRFPLLVVGGLLLSASSAPSCCAARSRGGFADTLSTYRASDRTGRGRSTCCAEESGPARRPALRGSPGDGREVPAPRLILLAVEVEGAREDDPDETLLAAERDAGLEDEDAPHEGFNACTPPSSTTTSGRSCSST